MVGDDMQRLFQSNKLHHQTFLGNLESNEWLRAMKLYTGSLHDLLCWSLRTETLMLLSYTPSPKVIIRTRLTWKRVRESVSIR